VHHPDPARAALRRSVLDASPQRVGEGITARVLETGLPLRVASLTDEFIRGAMKPEYWRYLEGAASLLIAPLEHRRQVVGHITLVRDAGGAPYTADDEALLADLAHRAAQAIENARLYGQAQAQVAARDEFLSIASHELRTPLTSLRLALENLRRVTGKLLSGTEVPREAAERALSVAERAGRRLEGLVEALLDVSRIHLGRLDLDAEEVELGTLVAEAVASVDDERTQSGSTLEVDGTPVQGRWDRLRLGQVVVNLVSNAIKYGSGHPITIRYGSRGSWAYLSVQDRGIGIARDDQAHIFERFERAVSSRNYGGLGLGLFIVKRIVEAHGGLVRVESEPGQGSTFTVDLPPRPEVAVDRPRLGAP
jgi:signal transduction histidine kinase